MNELNTHSFQ